MSYLKLSLKNSPDSDSMYLFPLFSFLNPFQTHSRSLPPNHVTVHSHFSPVYRNWILPMLHIPNRQNASTVPRKNSDRSPPGTLSSAFPGCVRALPCFRTQSTGPYSKYTCSGTFSLCCPKILPIRSPVRLFRTLPPSLWRIRHFLPCRLSPPGPTGQGPYFCSSICSISFFRLS